MAQEPEKKEERKSEAPKKSTSSTQTNQPFRGGRSSTRTGQQSRHQQRRPYQQRRRFHRRKVCAFCVDKTKVINWKNVDDLRRYVADSGSIFPRRKTGLCARHQRSVAVAIKQARHIALLPYTNEHVRIMGKS